MPRRPRRPLQLDRPRDVGAIVDDAWLVYRRHWRTLVLIAAVVVVPVQLIVFGVGLGWLTQGYDAQAPAGETIAGAFAQLLVATPLVTAMTVHVVLDAAEGGGGVDARRSVLAGLEAFRHLFLAIVLVALGVSLGLLLLILPGIVLAVRWAVVPQVVVVEGREGAEALRGSWALTRGQGWYAFAVVFVANVLVALVGVAFSYPLQLAADSADAQSLLLLGQALGQIFSLPLLAVAETLLYFSLRATRAGATPYGPRRGVAAPGQEPHRAEPPAPEVRHGTPPVPEAPRPADPAGDGPGRGGAAEDDPFGRAGEREEDPFGRRREEGWEPPVSGY